MSAPEAVVFDIGNVLIEWRPEEFYDGALGEARRRALFAAVDLHGMNERIDLGEGFRDLVYDLGAAHPPFEADVRLWHDRWLEMLSPVVDRSVRLLRALRARGVPVHALTNFGAETFDIAIRHFDFLNEFDRTFVSGRLKLVKPDAGIYATVEDDLRLYGDAILFVDDRAANVDAAAARGWRTHLFEAPGGWADRLVSEGLLTAREAA